MGRVHGLIHRTVSGVNVDPAEFLLRHVLPDPRDHGRGVHRHADNARGGDEDILLAAIARIGGGRSLWSPNNTCAGVTGCPWSLSSGG